MCLYVDTWGYVHMLAGALVQKECVKPLGAGVAGSFELPSMGSRD